MADNKPAIVINDDALTKVMAQAVMTYLTPEKRDELMLQAVKEFLDAKSSSSYSSKTRIEECFHAAIQQVGKEIAEEMVRGDPKIQSRIRELFTTVITLLMEDKTYATKIVDGFMRSIRGY